jgi:hypothetical protein
MSTRRFVKKQVEKSRSTGNTTPFLRRLVLQLADEVLMAYYGPNYHSQCLQGSVAIQAILAELGFKSVIVSGAACFAEVAPGVLTWGGFWDEDHHVWVVAELGELIDLTISKLHLHPSSSRANFEPIPAVWWDNLDYMPCAFRYLPDTWGHVGTLLQADENELLVQLRANATHRLREFLAEGDPSRIAYGPILQRPRFDECITRGWSSVGEWSVADSRTRNSLPGLDRSTVAGAYLCMGRENPRDRSPGGPERS